jgi:hypothetical protein
MTLFIKNLLPSPRARGFRNQRWQGNPALASPRPMHETRRIILRKLQARMKAGNGLLA